MPDDEIDDEDSEKRKTKFILEKLKEIQLTKLTSNELDAIVEEIRNINKSFSIPVIHYTEKDGIDYVAVMLTDPKGAELKLTNVNDHLVYSGCDSDELIKKNGKMKCKEPQLYLVLHPKDEWESYHIRNLKA